MHTYVFASLRGSDFTITGNDPTDAYNHLCVVEQDEGTLWRLFDSYRNRTAISNEGFTKLDTREGAVAYKEID